MSMWGQVFNVALGVWLMVAPAALNYGGAARTSDRVCGPFIAALGWIAIAQCTRNARRGIYPFGAWLVAAPLIFGYPAAAFVNSMAAGLLAIAAASIEGSRTHHFGGGWGTLWRAGSCGTIDNPITLNEIASKEAQATWRIRRQAGHGRASS